MSLRDPLPQRLAELELVAAGLGVALLPSSVASAYTSVDVARVHVLDAPAHELCVSILSSRRQPHVRAFFQGAVEMLTRADETRNHPAERRPEAGLHIVA
ncbi:hypothetical protein [Frondihabitans cladoniiphilus]|uniref:LysR substrate binding domain-containing protein n=1 Tax=Frondihabitans cladoniiphilus TaxID=715785 RepID=A0ABP8W9N9_9MICO